MPQALRSRRPLSAGRRAAAGLSHAWAQHRARLGLCLAVAVAALAVRGAAGVLLAIVALMLTLDTLIPLPGTSWSQADDRFWQLVHERDHARRMRRMHHLPPERLQVLDDRAGWVSVAQRRPLGIRPIPIDSITGTVEETRARSFDGQFRPDRSEAERWRRMWIAQARGVSLPPISVYRVDGRHIVRDGHHRVSVARHNGLSTIDADVVELRRG